MPTIAGETSTSSLQNLVSEIYGRKWCVYDVVAGKASSTPSRRVKFTGLQYSKERERNGHTYKNRPFSANLIPSKQADSPLSMSNYSRSLALADVERLKTATFKRKKKLSAKIPEYDSSKVISDSASARNKALAAEYIEMLSGKNYLKRHYREQYWINDAASRNRPQTATASSGERGYATLYPDLGSTLSKKAPHISATIARPQSFSHSSATWRLPSTPRGNPARIPASTQLSNAFSDERRVVVAELGVSFEAKKSWSNVPSGKYQRACPPSYPNETLASLCLEGRSAPSRTSNSRTSSISSTISITRMLDGRYSSTGESTPSGSSDATGGSRTGSGDEDPIKSFVDSANETAPPNENISTNSSDADENIDVPRMVDSVFEDEDDQIARDNDVVMDEVLNDDECEGLVSDKIEKGAGRMSFSDLEESDISENEADDYEEDTIDEIEVNRRLKQVSAVFDATRDTEFHAAVPASLGNDRESSASHSDSDNDVDNVDGSSECMQYSDILPKPYSQFDLKGFANVPPGMDWRAFMHSRTANITVSSKLCNNSKDNEQRVRLRRKNERESAKQRSIEGFVDRLVMLEKLQVISVQFERDRKKHLIHRAKARNAAKAASTSQANSSNANAAVSTSPKDSEGRPPSGRAIRRRPSSVGSTPLISSRSRKSHSDAKPELCFGNKPSPDLDLVRLSCTKNHLQYFKRHSTSPRKKQRQSLFLPRHYEYSWSERLPPSKRPSLNSLFYTKPRSCQYCRESEKRAHLQSLQILMNRPRSSSYNVSNKPGTHRVRPISSSAIINSESRHDPTAPRNITCSQVATPGCRDGSTFGRAASASSLQAKINVARISLTSVARDYAKAADEGGKFSRRTSASSFRGCRSGRYSPAVNMNKKK